MLDVNTVTSRALLTPQLNFSETSCIQPVTTAYTDTMTTNSASGNISDTEFLKSEENRVTATVSLFICCFSIAVFYLSTPMFLFR